MKKRQLIAGAVTVSAAVMLSACGKDITININDNGNVIGSLISENGIEGLVSGNDADETEPAEEVYSSTEGWSVTYDPALFAVNEGEDGDVTSFVYQGESAGTNMVTISYIKDKQPEEAMSELTDSWGDPEAIERSESYFPGTNDKWGYWRCLPAGEEGSGLTERVFAGEYNDGVLMFEFTEHRGSDTSAPDPAATALQALVDSITFEDFGPQNMYDYIPGVYVRTFNEEIEGEDMTFQDTVTLNEDHSGVLSLQDDLYVMWGSNMLIQADNSYEYTIEGDKLMLNLDGDWLEFTRQGTDDEIKAEDEQAADEASDEAKENDEASGKLPVYKYNGDDKLTAAVYQFMIDDYASQYDKSDVSIPCIMIVGTDESDSEDIRVYGDFWLLNYDLEGDTLECKSGGSYPGCIHFKKIDSGYEALKMDMVEDGSGYTPSAKKIFGDMYEDFEKVSSDDQAREKTRAQIISDYVKDNKLSITKYHDFGWDPVVIN